MRVTFSCVTTTSWNKLLKEVFFQQFFQLITLPVEFNASRRALEGMRDSGLFTQDELSASREVLSAAAMTYVAALATSLLSLLRLIVIASGRRRD